MLILTRKKNESIIINDNIEITIVDSDDGKVKIGIDAPLSVKIFRKEVYDAIIEENKAAATSKGDVNKLKDFIIKKEK